MSRFSALKRIVSFPVTLGCLLALLGELTVVARFDDPDLWWNLKTGEVIWNTHTIPTTDLFSYTTHHHAWVPHEWLAQLFIYAAYRCAGYPGLMLWLCLLTAAVLLSAYILCSVYSGNSKVGFAGALTVWLFATSGLSIRPQMVGYLLLLIELLLIHFGRTRSPRWFFALPVLFSVWVNCHASFALGMAVGVLVLGSAFFHFRSGSLAAQQWDACRRRALAIGLGLSLPALFLNPVGLGQILYPLKTMLHMPLLLASVAEYAPLRLSDGRGIALMCVLLCSFLLVAVHKAELYLHEALLLGAGTWLAVSHFRMLFVFGILAAPVLSRQLAGMWDAYDPGKDRLALNAALASLCLLAGVLVFPGRDNLARQVEAHSPVRALAFIRAHRLSGPMLNDHQFGGYMIWAAPELPVFVDGRTDVFEWSGVFGEFGRWATMQTDPSALLDKYGVQFCLLTRTSPMARVLPLLPDWKIVYADSNAVIAARTPAAGNLDVGF